MGILDPILLTTTQPYKMNQDPKTKDNFNELVSIASQRPIVLFLGAGVNAGARGKTNADFAPLWNKLLESLLDKALRSIPGKLNEQELNNLNQNLKKSDVYYIASVIKHLLGEQYLLQLNYQLYGKIGYNRKEFIECLKIWKKNKPYELEYNSSENKNCPTLLFQIAEMCAACLNIHAVVTYNYDEYLSVLINSLKKRKAEDVYHYKQQKKIVKDQLLIYHVHGFIPSDENLMNETPENIVLAYDEYFQNMMEPYSWQTATQLHFLMNYTCVFIGASLNDWNMLRILSNARRYSSSTNHYAFFKSQGKEKESIVENRLKATVLDGAGINIIYSKDFNTIFDKIKKLNNSLIKTNKYE